MSVSLEGEGRRDYGGIEEVYSLEETSCQQKSREFWFKEAKKSWDLL